MLKDEATKKVIQRGIDDIDNYKGQNIEASELHHHLYNQDYFIIGAWKGQKFLEEFGIFNAINIVKTYQEDTYGEVKTDFSDAEQVANEFAYIVGEEALDECPTLQKNWDKQLTDADLEKIKAELEAQL